jgi:hypothetical protein
MNQQTLKNIAIFLERVTVTGKEAFAWCEAYGEIQTALQPTALPVAPADGTP